MATKALLFSSIISSSVGKKIITGLTGLGLIGFAVGHLAGNLLLLNPDPEPFNRYAHTLESLGVLLYVIEAGLTLFFLLHAYNGIMIYINKKKARPQDYGVYKTQGGKSKQTISSRSMAITGSIILIFLVLHLLHFKFGPHYTTTIEGLGEVRDLYKTVIEYFQGPLNVAFYVAVMLLLGIHLRHGFWSAFQSLGAMKPRWSNMIYSIGLVVAIVLSVGFLILPIYIFIMH